LADIAIVEGSATRSGTLHAVTRGLKQTSETIDAGSHTRVVYNDGTASTNRDGSSSSLSVELAASALSLRIPIVFLESVLEDPESALKYIGSERIDGRRADHIQVWKHFNDDPDLQPTTPLTLKDIWIDCASQLPLQISYKRFYARGATYAIP